MAHFVVRFEPTYTSEIHRALCPIEGAEEFQGELRFNRYQEGGTTPKGASILLLPDAGDAFEADNISA